jgi:stalled ribosome alternative rescue factor ArfA
MTKTRNPLAACLAHGAYAPKKVKPAKGKGSFKRQDKHRARSFD